MGTIVKKETEILVGFELWEADLRCKFIEVAYSTGTCSVSSKGRPPMVIFNRKQESLLRDCRSTGTQIATLEKMMAGSESRRYSVRPKQKEDVPGHSVIEAVNDGLTAAAD